jgi:hypothetical protein
VLWAGLQGWCWGAGEGSWGGALDGLSGPVCGEVVGHSLGVLVSGWVALWVERRVTVWRVQGEGGVGKGNGGSLLGTGLSAGWFSFHWAGCC